MKGKGCEGIEGEGQRAEGKEGGNVELHHVLVSN